MNAHHNPAQMHGIARSAEQLSPREFADLVKKGIQISRSGERGADRLRGPVALLQEALFGVGCSDLDACFSSVIDTTRTILEEAEHAEDAH